MIVTATTANTYSVGVAPTPRSGRPIYDRLPSASEKYNKRRAYRYDSGHILVRPRDSTEALLFQGSSLNAGVVTFANGNTYACPQLTFGIVYPAAGIYWAFLTEGRAAHGTPVFTAEIRPNVWLNVTNMADFELTTERKVPTAALAKIIYKSPQVYQIRDERQLIESGNEPVADWLTRMWDDLIIDVESKANNLFANTLWPKHATEYTDWAKLFFGWYRVGYWSAQYKAYWKDIFINSWQPQWRHPLCFKWDWRWQLGLDAADVEIFSTSDANSLQLGSYTYGNPTPTAEPRWRKYTLVSSNGPLDADYYTLPADAEHRVRRVGVPRDIAVSDGDGWLIADIGWLGIQRSRAALATFALLADICQLSGYDDELLVPANKHTLWNITAYPLRPWVSPCFYADESQADHDRVGPARAMTYYIRLPLIYTRNGQQWTLAEHITRNHIATYVDHERFDKPFRADISATEHDAVDLPPNTTIEQGIAVYHGRTGDPIVSYAYFVSDYSACDEPVFDYDYPYINELLTIHPLPWACVRYQYRRAWVKTPPCSQVQLLDYCEAEEPSEPPFVEYNYCEAVTPYNTDSLYISTPLYPPEV